MELCRGYKKGCLRVVKCSGGGHTKSFQDWWHLNCKDELLTAWTRSRGRKEDDILSGQSMLSQGGSTHPQCPDGYSWEHLQQSGENGRGWHGPMSEEQWPVWREGQTRDHGALALIPSNSLQPSVCFGSIDNWSRGLSQLLGEESEWWRAPFSGRRLNWVVSWFRQGWDIIQRLWKRTS